MSPTHVLDDVLTALHDGVVFKKIFSVGLAVVACVIPIGATVPVAGLIAIVFGGGFDAPVRLGAVLLSCALIATAWAEVNIFMFHSRRLARLPTSRFVIASLVESVVRMTGEAYAVGMIGIGTGGLLASFFGAAYLVQNSGVTFLPGLPSPGMTGFAGGLFFFLAATVIGFLGLVIAYWAAECWSALFDIAINVGRIAGRSRSSTPVVADAALDGFRPTAPTLLLTELQHRPCPRCRAEMMPGQLFCTECGASDS